MGRLPAYLDTDIANARQGLKAGYSLPKDGVRREIARVEGGAEPRETIRYPRVPRQVLEDGTFTLPMLDEKITRWITERVDRSRR